MQCTRKQARIRGLLLKTSHFDQPTFRQRGAQSNGTQHTALQEQEVQGSTKTLFLEKKSSFLSKAKNIVIKHVLQSHFNFVLM